MHSCIYNGWVRHRRYEPAGHQFRYELFMMYLDLAELPLATLQGFHASISADVADVLTLRGSLNARNVLGGTAPVQVRAQIARHRTRLA